ALRSALSVHADRGSLAVFDATSFGETPSTKQAAKLLQDWGQPLATLVLLDGDESTAGLSFRNMWRVIAMPAEDAGVADLIGAASLLVSEAALEQLTARANGEQAETAEEVAA
ncbi:MAG TPA: 50S ribosomal protein L4, partial [Conexibacter sp.]|nr:50S ribosomal protein L4 [Conexibacter sp.]